MLGIYLRMVKDKWKSVLIYIGSATAFSEMYVALYPALKDTLAETEQFLEAFPKEFMEAFGFSAEDLTFPTIESFISTEMFTFIWPIIVIIMAISLANMAFSGDIAKGTIELALAQPISRLRLFISRYLAGLTAILAFVWASVFVIIPLAAMHGIEYNVKSYLVMSVMGSLFALSIYGLAILASAIFSEKGKVTFTTTGILITMYALNIASGLLEKLENLKYISFFHYFDPGMALNDLAYVEYAIPVFLGVAIVTPIIGAFFFARRNIAT
ncbi:MAG: ABC transporter permease subunit [Patescibacteria group bacterium]|nr:ABC transporter permease subunit [Patescibacteria group bacterium]